MVEDKSISKIGLLFIFIGVVIVGLIWIFSDIPSWKDIISFLIISSISIGILFIAVGIWLIKLELNASRGED